MINSSTYPLLSMALALCSVAVSVQAAEPIEPLAELSYAPFPDGYDYMDKKQLKTLEKAIKSQDTKIIREQAWKLWAGIMQPGPHSDWPVWMSWQNSSQVFAEKPVKGDVNALNTQKIHHTMRAQNKLHSPKINTQSPLYRVPDWILEHYPDSVSYDIGTQTFSVKDGKYFLSNGDIMIATESISDEGVKSLVDGGLTQVSTLNKLHKDGVDSISVNPWTIVTKHMFWPVKKEGLTGLPVWWDKQYKTDFSGYVGYETWDRAIAIDPSGAKAGTNVEVSYLYNLHQYDGTPLPTAHKNVKAYSINDFYHHKVTQADWDTFDKNDQAIIHSASLWANGRPFEVGDFLVTVAMHINTKQLPDWTLESVWWSDTPDEGEYSTHRPSLDQAKGPWKHYLLTEAFQTQGDKAGDLPIAVNPYIEGVTHPIATNCRNCHVRAGWPEASKTLPNGASYQNPLCQGLLTALAPQDSCFKSILLTDFMWIVPDRAN